MGSLEELLCSSSCIRSIDTIITFQIFYSCAPFNSRFFGPTEEILVNETTYVGKLGTSNERKKRWTRDGPLPWVTSVVVPYPTKDRESTPPGHLLGSPSHT